MDEAGWQAGEKERKLRIPRHVAIIMDGNGRWAQARRLPRFAGHKAGVETVRSVVEHSVKLGVEVLTLFAFSSENWRRPRKEVDLLMDLFLLALEREVRRLRRNDVRLRVIGDRSAFSQKLQARIAEAEQTTADCRTLTLQIAANYGGRWDIVHAARALAQRVNEGTLDANDIDETLVGEALTTSGLPDPDLFIRTGGEQRLSNFLLWQSAYAELYLTSVLWPDFNVTAYEQALQSFSLRQRRFGRTTEQVLADSISSGSD
ncbi:MAG: isoprenyl transferase [Gammaproteobacteria bacterium]|nr:isoprenyl transferase [Gammaproteobacteria bacterium]